MNTVQKTLKKLMYVYVYTVTIFFFYRDGKSRTGLFLVLANLIEQTKLSNSVDVFRTVKDLRDMRPESIDSLVR